MLCVTHSYAQYSTTKQDSTNIYLDAIKKAFDANKKIYLLGNRYLYNIQHLLPKEIVLTTQSELVKLYKNRVVELYEASSLDLNEHNILNVSFTHYIVTVNRKFEMEFDCWIYITYEFSCIKNGYVFKSKNTHCL